MADGGRSYGRGSLDLAASEESDLIILDISMLVMDGFEAFKSLRSSPFTDKVPIIMLTAINANNPDVHYDAAMMEKKFGVSRPEGFVDKPVDPDFLLASILGVMG